MLSGNKLFTTCAALLQSPLQLLDVVRQVGQLPFQLTVLLKQPTALGLLLRLMTPCGHESMKNVLPFSASGIRNDNNNEGP